jgi:aryl-alcohol dehydrogenase-like predicted oxidoreductase
MVPGGILGKQKEGRSAEPRIQEMLDKNRPAIEAWEQFCDERGEHPAGVGLAWLLH